MSKKLVDQIENDWQAERPDLDAGPVATCVRLQLAARRVADAAAGAVAAHGLEWWAYDVLSALRRAGKPFEASVSELAHAAQLSPAAMTNRLDGLQSAGLLKRRPNPVDRRGVLVRLTAKGRQRVDAASQARFDSAEVALARLSATQRRKLDQLLDCLAWNGGEQVGKRLSKR